MGVLITIIISFFVGVFGFLYFWDSLSDTIYVGCILFYGISFIMYNSRYYCNTHKI